MPLELIQYYLNLPLFLLVLSRIGGLIMFQPILAALSVPAVVRALLALGLAGLVVPFVPYPPDMPVTAVGLVIGMAGELMLGALLGLVASLLFVGLQMGGQLIAQEAGLSFGQIADPASEEQMSILSSLYLQLGALIFVAIGGHRALLAVSLDSFQSVPLLVHGDLLAVGSELIIGVLQLSGEVAIRVAAPAIITVFLINLAMGFISRTVPQLNIMVLGFTIKGIVAFILIAASLPAAGSVFVDALATILDGLRAWLRL